jgi:kanamycin kinase
VTEAEHDYLLTEKVPGHDALEQLYLNNPKRLCETLAQQLRLLHELDYRDCPVQNLTDHYLSVVEQNYQKNHYDVSYGQFWDIRTPERAYDVVQANKHLLKNDTLLHVTIIYPISF